jgi:hypothetical protein
MCDIGRLIDELLFRLDVYHHFGDLRHNLQYLIFDPMRDFVSFTNR